MDLKIARLRTVFSLVPPCDCLIDVGTDHGYLAVALAACGKVNRLIASDYNKGPLASAAAYVAEQGLIERIELRLGDGLTVLAQDAKPKAGADRAAASGAATASFDATTASFDATSVSSSAATASSDAVTASSSAANASASAAGSARPQDVLNIDASEVQGACICGMGGFLMKDIIEASPQRLSFYVLQPQNGLAELRHYMRDKGYRIVAEEACHDRGHDYEAWLLVDEQGPQWLLDYCEARHPGAFTRDVYKDLADDDFRWEFGYYLCAQGSEAWRLHMERQRAIGQKERSHIEHCKGQEDRVAYLDRRLAFIEQSLAAFTREEDGSVSS